MPMHFCKAVPGKTCLICGAPLSEVAPVAISKNSNARVSRNYTNDAGFWNSMPDRCKPRHQLVREGGRHTLVGVHTAAGPKLADALRILD